MLSFNSLWSSDAMTRSGSASSLVQVMACCLPSHYLNQWWHDLDWTLRNECQLNLNHNIIILIQKYISKWRLRKKSAIFLNPNELTPCGLVTAHDDKRVDLDNGSGNGLLPDDTKPLPEPMLTPHQWTLWHSPATSPRGLQDKEMLCMVIQICPREQSID